MPRPRNNSSRHNSSSSRHINYKKNEDASFDYYKHRDDEYGIEKVVNDPTSQIPPEDDVYIVKQRAGYFSIIFSVIQTAVLICMTWQCGLAPFNINPMIGPYPDALDYWGAKNTILIVDDREWWRLITPIFLHAGLIHLFGNVSVQLETGAFFEREWGSGTWLVIYLTSALSSSLLSCISMPNSLSVGSSGAVMGLFGAKLSEVFCRACESKKTAQGRIGHEVRMEQLSGVLCSVLIVGLFSFIPYVDWAAHLGGLLGGQIVGMVIFSSTIKSLFWCLFWALYGLLGTGIGFSMAVMYLYTNVQPEEELRDVCGYYQQFFEDYECNCQLKDNWDGWHWNWSGNNYDANSASNSNSQD